MATRGVPQLQRIMIRYCDWGGSSSGMRDFIGRELVGFARTVPQCEIVTEVRRNRHPMIKADYCESNSVCCACQTYFVLADNVGGFP
jgi:large subunit ribosomal protein L43